MTRSKEVTYFIKNNSEKKINNYVMYLKQNIENSIKHSNLLTKWLIILVIIFYLLSESLIEKLHINLLEINNIDFLKQAIIPLIGIIIFLYVITICYRGELTQVLKCIFLKTHKLSEIEANDFKFYNINNLERVSNPISYFTEMVKFKRKKITSWSNILYSSYLFILQIIPFVFIYNGLSFIYKNHFDSKFGIFCFFFTIFSLICALTYFGNFILNGIDDEEEIIE